MDSSIKETKDISYTEKTSYTDFTFVTSDGELYYCKRTLAINSPFFKNMFSHNMVENNENKLDCSDDYDSEDIKYLLLYLDNTRGTAGKSKVDNDNYKVLLQIANTWQFPELIDDVIRYIKNYRWMPNVIMKYNDPVYTQGIYGDKFKEMVNFLIYELTDYWDDRSFDVNKNMIDDAEVFKLEYKEGTPGSIFDVSMKIIASLIKKVGSAKRENHTKMITYEADRDVLIKERSGLKNKVSELQATIKTSKLFK